ncbi:MAG TPA: AraC family transcriptional regulator [Steroidobacteraceae bacterium]|nr:AraC family transcriptional regulator [Steroidobacteraceae bacterium]
MLLRSLPDLTQSNTEFQSWFQSKWGRENCIIWGRTRLAEFGPCTHTLSIRAAWGGVEHCYVNGRTLAVDDDNFLILNHGQIYSTSIRSVQPVESLAICFKPQMAEQAYSEVSASIEQALARGDAPAERTPDFMENLHPHENSVSPVLRFIRAHASSGIVDESWYDEQLVFLLARMQGHHQRLLEQVERIALIRPATRREVYRRISLATDFLHSNYSQDVDLSTLAKMAYLSKYHFLRLFTLVHGITPRTYLQRKRINVAIRLLESTRMTMSEVSASVGFAEESTLVRQMRRWTKLTPRQVRQRVMAGHAAA